MQIQQILENIQFACLLNCIQEHQTHTNSIYRLHTNQRTCNKTPDRQTSLYSHGNDFTSNETRAAVRMLASITNFSPRREPVGISCCFRPGTEHVSHVIDGYRYWEGNVYTSGSCGLTELWTREQWREVTAAEGFQLQSVDHYQSEMILVVLWSNLKIQGTFCWDCMTKTKHTLAQLLPPNANVLTWNGLFVGWFHFQSKCWHIHTIKEEEGTTQQCVGIFCLTCASIMKVLSFCL